MQVSLCDWADWDGMIDTNIKGLLAMTRLIVPGMIERGRGHIVNIGSVAGDAAYANGAVYCATKAAVKTLTDGLRIDLVKTPVRVTLLKPGLVETNFSRVRFHGDKERAENVYKGIVPLTADDIADACAYAVNAPIQGSAADIIKVAMVSIFNEMESRGLRSRMLMQVHDELVFNIVPDELEEMRALVTAHMENAYHGAVPLTVSAGVADNWLGAH